MVKYNTVYKSLNHKLAKSDAKGEVRKGHSLKVPLSSIIETHGLIQAMFGKDRTLCFVLIAFV